MLRNSVTSESEPKIMPYQCATQLLILQPRSNRLSWINSSIAKLIWAHYAKEDWIAAKQVNKPREQMKLIKVKSLPLLMVPLNTQNVFAEVSAWHREKCPEFNTSNCGFWTLSETLAKNKYCRLKFKRVAVFAWSCVTQLPNARAFSEKLKSLRQTLL